MRNICPANFIEFLTRIASLGLIVMLPLAALFSSASPTEPRSSLERNPLNKQREADCSFFIEAARLKKQFLLDPAFHWLEGAEKPLDRQPPNVFGSKLYALLFPTLRQLPTGLPKQAEAFFEQIFLILRDRSLVFDLLKAVELDVMKLADRDAEFSKQEQAFLVLLQVYEEPLGFETVAISGRLTTPKFLQIVAEGKTFIDQSGDSLSLSLASDTPALAGAWVHGINTHRLQWHLILRAHLLWPHRFPENIDLLAMYKLLGDNEMNARLDWSATGIAGDIGSDQRTLFFQLFDSAENNGSSPGFYLAYHRYWSRLPLR